MVALTCEVLEYEEKITSSSSSKTAASGSPANPLLLKVVHQAMVKLLEEEQ